MSIPSGRIMNTFIQEYVLNDHPSRWSNGQQKEIVAHWFEPHPRACVEDDGGYSSAESLHDYSRDISSAMALTSAPLLKGTSMNMKTVQGKEGVSVRYWASFFDVPFESKSHRWQDYWADGETMALAICRAALISTSRD
jgi:hypothetical protein